MKNKVAWISFAVLCLLQLWLPASVIFSKENIISNGVAYKFKTVPRDPNDYLRGKYIKLTFVENNYPVDSANFWNKEVYVSIANDSSGYAKITGISESKPLNGRDYIKTNIRNVNFRNDPNLRNAYVEWPFERFYMEESKAPAAEIAYNKLSSDSSNVGYALVKVKDGEAVLENVFFNDKPISDYLKNENE